jgi:hypothetical protein
MPIHRRTPDRAYRRTTSSVRPTPPRSHSDPSHSRCCVDQLNSPSAGVVVVDQLAGSHWMSGAVSVLQRDPQRDENQIGAFVGGDMPGHDPLGEQVDDEGDVAKSGPGSHMDIPRESDVKQRSPALLLRCWDRPRLRPLAGC